MEWTLADVVLALGLTIAVYTDLTSERIPNVLTFPLILVGIVIHFVQGNFLLPLLGVGVAFALHFVLWMLKVERGGDAKLMMAVGALLGWSEMLESTLWMFLLLFPIGLAVLTVRGRLRNFIETVKFAYRRAIGYPVDPPAEQTMMAFGPVIACAVVAARLTDWLYLWE